MLLNQEILCQEEERIRRQVLALRAFARGTKTEEAPGV